MMRMRETGGREKEMDFEIEMGGLTGRVSNQTDGRETEGDGTY